MKNRKLEKAIKETKFEIKTLGDENVIINFQGCPAGLVYKFSNALISFVRQDILTEDDIYKICKYTIKRIHEDEKENNEGIGFIRNGKMKVAELEGNDAFEFLSLLDQLQKRGYKPNEIDFDNLLDQIRNKKKRDK